MRVGQIIIAFALAMTVAGCGIDGSSPQLVVAAPTSPPTVAAPSGGLLNGAVGAALSEKDRKAAYEAQIAALDSGQRRSWKGSPGTFGFVEVAAEAGTCRAYTQTIYVKGRPSEGKGQACKEADGQWKMNS